MKLHLSVYGLKQGSRLFNQLLVSNLVSIGFVACPSDTCLMYLLLRRGSDIVLMAINVDDLLLYASSLSVLLQNLQLNWLTSFVALTWVKLRGVLVCSYTCPP